jgi:prepilin-type N-terminal cleavage/methylation domain-containing protein
MPTPKRRSEKTLMANHREHTAPPAAFKRMRGFSLVEMLIVVVMIFIASSIAVMNVGPALNQNRVTNAYNTVLGTVRRGREQAVAERQIYILTFNKAVSPNVVTLARATVGNVIATYALPDDITFRTEPGIPNTVATTPDGFGTASNAIDFDIGVGAGGSNVIYFLPDGSAKDKDGNFNNGVVYMARSGELLSSRAITVWGVTGRIRGWRLYANSGAGTNVWRQQ